MATDTIIRRGFDFLTTITAKQRITIPRSFGISEDFDEMVAFVGATLPQPYGNADTVMERLEDASIGKPVHTRLAAFANVSAAPLRLFFGRAGVRNYDLYVTLSPSQESPGRTTYHQDNEHGGTFESEVSLTPVFELRPLADGESITIDAAKTPVPGFPMRLGSTGGRWSLRPPSDNAARGSSGETLFYESEVLIRAERDGHSLAACAKQQAQVSKSRFERRNFPHPR